MHAVFEREEVPAEQATSRPVDPVEKKPAAAKGKKGKGRARKEPARRICGGFEWAMSAKIVTARCSESSDVPRLLAMQAEPRSAMK
jgi:hypothetical protein